MIRVTVLSWPFCILFPVSYEYPVHWTKLHSVESLLGVLWNPIDVFQYGTATLRLQMLAGTNFSVFDGQYLAGIYFSDLIAFLYKICS